MKYVLLDTNFIMSCVKQNIDFFEDLEFKGFKILIPKQVISELEGLKAETELKVLEKEKFSKIDLKSKNVDNAIINYSKKHPQTIIATLDREIKKKVINSKLVIRGKKKLEII